MLSIYGYSGKLELAKYGAALSTRRLRGGGGGNTAEPRGINLDVPMSKD